MSKINQILDNIDFHTAIARLAAVGFDVLKAKMSPNLLFEIGCPWCEGRWDIIGTKVLHTQPACARFANFKAFLEEISR